ncbi:hypothetical protein OG478_52630 [Streptomyces phaeochromogenes]|uniref:hypothetical protein n=1 Tax=Streptomyces phaeochromogenes TaxID=1923 RepID=UPI003865EDB0|nr:hypothetical protein OG478_00110 [Streptomyces phaeochromogenes]WSS99679.1 hypothetical protein OG478_52630 [Streptomyces phaeochromogenes]
MDDLSDPVLSEVKTAVVLHRPAAPHTRDRVDLIAARGWRATGTAAVRFEPEYHRLVDLPNT